MVSDLGFQCRAASKRLVNTTEIVPSNVQSNTCPQVCQLRTECIYQPRESSKMHQLIRIRSLDMPCADMREIGLATDSGWTRFDNLGWRVPIRSRVIRLAANLTESGKVNVGAEAFFHCSDVRSESIRGNLGLPATLLLKSVTISKALGPSPFATR